ncbi:hypothetical protein RYX36_021491 [Vicia faba]
MSPMSPSPFAQPISPSGNGISHSNNPWPQPNVPALHLHGSNIQSSRLRSSLCARDMPLEDFNNMRQDFDGQQHILNDINCFSQPRLGAISVSRFGRSKTLTPSNLEDLFSAEVSSSPWYSDPAAASVFSQCTISHRQQCRLVTFVFDMKQYPHKCIKLLRERS